MQKGQELGAQSDIGTVSPVVSKNTLKNAGFGSSWSIFPTRGAVRVQLHQLSHC